MLAQNQPIQAALYVGIINMTARFIMFLVLTVVVRRITKIIVPWNSIAKYIGASTAMALFLEAFLRLFPQPRITLVLAATAIGGLIYLMVLMAIDVEARALPRLVLKQLRQKQTENLKITVP